MKMKSNYKYPVDNEIDYVISKLETIKKRLVKEENQTPNDTQWRRVNMAIHLLQSKGEE